MAGPLLALEDEAPLVAVISCFIVTSSSPIRQNFSGGRSHSSDPARLWLDEEGCSCVLCWLTSHPLTESDGSRANDFYTTADGKVHKKDKENWMFAHLTANSEDP